jgi:N-acetylglucosamine malate deacetylase 1
MLKSALKRIMVIAPHCDDAELGMGGSLAKWVNELDAQVLVVVLAVGDIDFLHLGRKVLAFERMQELEACHRILGVQRYKVLELGPESDLYSISTGRMTSKLDTVMQEFKPTSVFLPHESSHPDHKYAWMVSLAATRPSAAKQAIELVGAYEYPASSWGDNPTPNFGMYVDISGYVERKSNALAEFKSQLFRTNGPITTHGAEALARIRGIESNVDYAELITILRLRA